VKLDRRGFIKLAVGAVAGIHLTPIPWKYIDDSAIWTQNWPWVPRLTRYPELEYVPTVCTLCEGGCGIDVRVVNGERSVKVEGRASSPVNQGKVCPIGAAGPQYEYGLSRFQSPLKRIAARGSGAYRQISWNEALKEVGGKLAELRDNGEAHTVALISGRRHSLTTAMAAHFATVYGTPNLMTMPSLGGSEATAEFAQFGSADRVGLDLENSTFVLSFGCQIIEGWGAPVRSIQAYGKWKDGGRTRFVQVDSWASLTASKSDQWVAISPGTEAALAMGLAQIIINDGLFNKAFVDKHTYGFEEFKALCTRDYTPDKVEAITGIQAEKIINLAREFAAAEAPLAIAGKGRGALPTPGYELMAVMALNALVGNVNQPGGIILRKSLPISPWPEVKRDDNAERSLKAPRLDMAGSRKYPLTVSLIDEFVESVNTGRFYPVNMLILDQANPGYFGADPGAFRRALAKIPYVVSLSSMADDTSILADIVLPAASNFDGPVDVVNPPTLPFPMFGAAGPVLPKPGFDVRPAGDIYIGLAKAVGGSVESAMPFAGQKNMIDRMMIGLFESGRGLVASADPEEPDWEFGAEPKTPQYADLKEFYKKMAAGLFWFDPSFTYGDLTDAFATPSGKFEFYSQKVKEAFAPYFTETGIETGLAELGYTGAKEEFCLPHFEPYMPETGSSHYPFVMIPSEQFKLVTGSIGNAPYLTKLLEDNVLVGKDLVVMIHPETAEAAHLNEGDAAWLQTPKGKLSVRIHIFKGARPGVIYAPIGLGRTGYGYYLRDKGVNPMQIVEARPDPLTGQRLWWGTRANLTKV
jgi:menaquinone reductase, molybdopterin-binding-like subunit